MLALVKTPHIEIKGEVLPEALIAFLKRKFGTVEVVNEDESVPFEQSQWYKETKAGMTPAVNLKRRRERAGMTQKNLAELIEIAPTCVSDMEHGRRPIGKAMAKKFANALGCSPVSFYW